MTVVTTKKQLVYEALKGRRWLSGYDIEGMTGDFGLRRLRELREDGYIIKSRRKENGEYEYRMTGRA